MAIPRLIVSPWPAAAEDVATSHSRALGQHVGAVLVAVGRDQGELLSSHPRRAVEAPLDRPERGRHSAQRFVSGRVPQRLVHAREAVQIGHDEAERRIAAPGPLELDVEARPRSRGD